MRRKATLYLVCIMLLGMLPAARAASLAFADIPPVFRPGKAERVGISCAVEGNVSLVLTDVSGNLLATLYDRIPAVPGVNHITWDGLGLDGIPLPEGQYVLKAEQGNQSVVQDIAVGAPSPVLSLSVSDATVVPGGEWAMDIALNMPGTLRIALDMQGETADVFNQHIEAGSLTVAWDGRIGGEALAPGMYMLSLTLTDDQGFSGNTQHVLLQVTDAPRETAQPVAAPSVTVAPPKKPHYTIPSKEPMADRALGSSYWMLPVGEWNEQAIWDVMVQPITVVVGGDQRSTYKLRRTPDSSTKGENIIGEISYEAQGVHVLETRDDGWALVEVFNSSYGPNCRSRPGWGNTDDLIKGYVQTENLKTITPRTDYGLLIDKLKQKMYVFKEGKLFTELVISTGKPTKQQPWNETPAGEFLMVSRTGTFNAGNLVCQMAMRVNGGALIHEVPYIYYEDRDLKDYSAQEAQLGEKASHGCIRVQRKNNADGINMTWLWNNIKVNTKVLIWDDFPGRFYEYPEDNMTLYYNPEGGKYYHTDQNCPSIRARFLPLPGSFTYEELDDIAYAKLKPCFACNPPLRKSDIDQINRENGF